MSAISDVNPDYAYGYGFDEAGNRNSATEAGTQLTYTTNALNQYASVSEGETSFVPEYDLDGNATRLRTSTGTWSVEYDAHNRPVSWRKSTGEVVYMIYDAQGRRTEKRVLNASGKRTLRERYVYVGYTCVQVLNGDRNNALVKEFAWDPTEPTATRPLTFRHAEKSLMLFYAFDGNKNVSDLFFLALQNGIGAHYEYAPFGAITRTSKATGSKVDLIGANPWRFSSEFHDSELDLVYYNYRYYSPTDGRWLSRDPIEERGGVNLYAYCSNIPNFRIDQLGNDCNCHEEGRFGECLTNCMFGAETAWAYTALGISFPAMSVPLKPFAPLGSTPTWTTLLSFIELKTGIKIGLRMLGRRLNPVSNLIALSALSFLLGRLIGCLGVCAIDDSTY